MQRIHILQSIAKETQGHSTITFGDPPENHFGMQRLGNLAKEGFSIQELEETKQKFVGKQCGCELVNLNAAVANNKSTSEEA